jgi:hypothetical protein
VKNVVRLLAVAAVVVLAGCATGPKLAEVKSQIPTLKPDEGRIYFYRDSTPIGAGIQPDIMLNGAKVGDSVPGGFFFVDQSPGAKEVSTSTEVERKLTFTLDRGQTRYVRTTVGMGLLVYRVYPELIDNATGEKEMADLSYTGPPLGKK